jgi:uncharacterized membrane protein
MNNNTKKLVFSALMAAIVCVATMIIKIPIAATGGYINLGDGMVILSGVILGPVYGALAAGIGSALADLISGYLIYAPATFLIKGVMALVVGLIIKKAIDKKSGAVILAGVIAEIIMVAGYFVFEATFMGYGLGAAAAIPGNAIQGVAGIVISALLIPVTKRIKM